MISITLALAGALVLTVAQQPWPSPTSLGPKSWFVLGPFDNEPAGANNVRGGFYKDFLPTLGGEAVAAINLTTKTGSASTRKIDEVGGIVDLRPPFMPSADLKVAYAYAEWNVPKAAIATAYFGSDDAAKVWLNGELVHKAETPGRQLIPDSEEFPVSLKQGRNRLLVKVENGTGDWGFSLRIYDEAGQKAMRAMRIRRDLESLDPGPEMGGFLLAESFPTIVWRRPDFARLVFGEQPIKVRWFGPDGVETKKPGKLGRYAALIEAKTADGYPYRRMLAFAKVPPQQGGFAPPPLTELPLLGIPDRMFGIDTPEGKGELSRHMWRSLIEYFDGREGGAILAGSMADPPKLAPGEPAWLASGFIRNAEYQLGVRRAVDRRTTKELPPPRALASPARELKAGTEAEAEVKQGTVEKLRAVCRDWLKDDPNGFVVLVARHGVKFMHEGFGGYSPTTTFAPASIGKSIAGLTFARAVDQGLIGYDDPIGSVLPDWAASTHKDVTFRYCFTHLTGLTGHASHGGLFNTYLDNALFVEDGALETPGVKHRYNGDGYNLAGKALEMLTGKSTPRLLWENLQRPFDEPVSQFDLGFGDQFTAGFLAKVGLMILNDGKYGNHELFKPGSLKKSLPFNVSKYAPKLGDKALEWGIGLTWMMDPGDAPRDRNPLGPNVIGHGSATASVWRVDLDHDLVVVIGRNAYKDYAGTGVWAAKFMKVLAEGLAP